MRAPRACSPSRTRASEPPAERARQPAQAAAEVERGFALQRQAQPRRVRDQRFDLALAGGEELVHVPAAEAARRVGEDGPAGIEQRQLVPVALLLRQLI